MRRSDAYEARARELAVAAGQDPDASRRAAGPQVHAGLVHLPRCRARRTSGGGGCGARDCRRRRPAFQNAPLQVFGQHDEATIAQMRNCMGVGNVVAGVVCADGHLGYAQPVGGVIAYEKPDQHLRRRLRHRLRQHGRPAGHAVRRHQGPRRRHPGRRAPSDLLRRRPRQRRARRARTVRRCRCVARVRHGRLPPEGGEPSSARSVPATTMSI